MLFNKSSKKFSFSLMIKLLSLLFLSWLLVFKLQRQIILLLFLLTPLYSQFSLHKSTSFG